MATKNLRGGLDPLAYDEEGNLKWTVVAAILSERDGVEYTARQVRETAYRAMRKLKIVFIRDVLKDGDGTVTLAYIEELEATKRALSALQHRVMPKKDRDYEEWGDDDS